MNSSKKNTKKPLGQLRNIEAELKCAPEGNLIISHDGPYSKWYNRVAALKCYIPKTNRKLAEQLAAKKYLFMLREELLKEKKALEAYLRLHPVESAYNEILNTAPPDFLKLLAPHFRPLSRAIRMGIRRL